MSDTNNRPNRDGSIRGDTADLPNKGTGTNVTDTYGADLGSEATNSKGGISGATKSNPEDQSFNKEDRI